MSFISTLRSQGASNSNFVEAFVKTENLLSGTLGRVHRDAPSRDIQEVAPSSAGQIRQMTHNGWTPLNRVLLGEQSTGRISVATGSGWGHLCAVHRSGAGFLPGVLGEDLSFAFSRSWRCLLSSPHDPLPPSSSPATVLPLLCSHVSL